MALTRSQQLAQLQHKLLHEYDTPVRAEDELLGLAAVMLEVIQHAIDELANSQTAAAAAQLQALKATGDELILKAKRTTLASAETAADAAVSRVAAQYEQAAHTLLQAAAKHNKAANLGMWTSACFGVLVVASGLVTLLGH